MESIFLVGDPIVVRLVPPIERPIAWDWFMVRLPEGGKGEARRGPVKMDMEIGSRLFFTKELPKKEERGLDKVHERLLLTYFSSLLNIYNLFY